MGEGSDISNIAIGFILAAWTLFSAFYIWDAIALRKRARNSLLKTARFSKLLDSAPAIPIIVKVGGNLEAPDRLARWLGLDRKIEKIADLAFDGKEGIATDILSQLASNINLAQKTAASFSQIIKVSGSERRFMIRGNIADSQIYPNGAALLWLFDATESASQIEKLQDDANNAKAAFRALAGIIEAAPIAAWHRDKQFNLTFVNEAYVKAVGAKNAQQVIEQDIELVEPFKGENAVAAAARAMEMNEMVKRTLPTTIYGARRQVEAYDVPLGDVGVAGFAIDVHNLAESQSEFRRFSEAQRELLDNMSAAVAQFDGNGILKFANLPFLRIFSIRAQWLADGPEFDRVLDKMREAGRIPEVRDFPEWRAQKRKWFQAPEPEEEHWLLQDGLHLRTLAQPVPDGGLILIFEDRTEQAQLSKARDTLLRARTATFDNLFEAVAVFGTDGKLNIWNRQFAEIWGVEEQILASHPRIDEMLQHMGRSLRKSSQISIIGEIIRASTVHRQQKKTRIEFADKRMFQMATMPLPDGSSLMVMIDISDSIQIEHALTERNAALSEADKVKSQFLANMSYEFRTPLTSIAGFAELLNAGVAGDLTDTGKEYVAAIIESAGRLTDQINMVLDFSQSQAGALPIEYKDIDLHDIIGASMANYSKQAKEKSLNLQYNASQQPLKIKGDAERLRQVFDQLIGNAVQHISENSDIIISSKFMANNVLVEVGDNGPGMSMAAQAVAFDSVKMPSNDMNMSAHKAKNGQSNGQSNGQRKGGLGLPLAKQLIELHGGKISVKSELGRGTVFSISLPKNKQS
ncbi:hypothetical protein LPB140_08175 [Sphingorhabdus lutea]|uniref:histidine kinase n=1 Tax=Sphingorhabdus lutea TaxID=1913578 RepID=A0A1L3JC91_9SPHN|nr:PAS domain-containing sensor histidine kinase [Sphingorhabdus lutea]APG62767.1 hypothetical protein LPB140_08175 [Sphingorhabdus lutea]